MKFITGLFLFLGLSQVSMAGYQCENPVWENDSHLKGKMFKGTLSINCQISTNSEIQFQKLKDFYVKKFTQSDFVLEVKKDPSPTSYEGIPATEFLSKISSNTEHGKMTIDMEYLIAASQGEGFILNNQSRKIKAKGNAKHTKLTGGRLKINKSSEGVLNFTYVKINHVKKPFIAPTSIFIRKVKEGIRKEFVEDYPQVINEVLDHI